MYKKSDKYIQAVANLYEEEKNSIKNSIIMKEMYEQGFKDGVNLIIDCKK